MLETEKIAKRREIQAEIKAHIEQLRNKLTALESDLASRKISLQEILNWDNDEPDVLEDFSISDVNAVLAVITQYETALAALPQI